MISKLALLLFLSLFSVHSLSDFKNDIKISSDTIEFLKKSNQINFFNNVEINSKFVKINAQIAAYDAHARKNRPQCISQTLPQATAHRKPRRKVNAARRETLCSR